MQFKDCTIDRFVAARNERKLLFTAGPASLLPENLTGLRPCFGRGDADYAAVEEGVLNSLRSLTGHQHIVRLQGSASLALELSTLNFLNSRVLVVETGYYSNRLKWLAESAARRTGAVTEVASVDWRKIDGVTDKFDWILACYVETSCGLKLPIEALKALAVRCGSRLMLDATASIGLESGHGLADVIAFSSCKGLFGLTGAAFIASHERPTNEVDSFYLDYKNHQNKMMTGPYHTICSLADVLPKHEAFRAAVENNKQVFLQRMQGHLTLPVEHQPLLCTHVDGSISSKNPQAVLYVSRNNSGGSVVCHLGEAHLGQDARGEILDALICE